MITKIKNNVGWDSVVGIATRYGLVAPGSNRVGGKYFCTRSDQPLDPTQPPVQWVPGLVPGGKAAGAWRKPRIPSSADVLG